MNATAQWVLETPPVTDSSCYLSTLEALAQPSCLLRQSFGNGPADGLAVYAAVVPKLSVRYETLRAVLTHVGAQDVTLIACVGSEEVASFDDHQRACLHPYYAKTQYVSKQTPGRLSNGTLSLSIKHAIAYLDMTRRGLHAILMLEDDAMVPGGIWDRLRAYHLPCDASLFWLSSYYFMMRIDGREHGRDVPIPGVGGAPRVFRRVEGSKIVSAAAYVITRKGATTMLSQPILAEADVALACIDCSSRRLFRTPEGQYRPGMWFIGQNRTLGRKSHETSRVSGHGQPLNSSVPQPGAATLQLDAQKVPSNRCFLQYHTYGGKKDSHEGLLHQMNSLGTALAEAHFLGRSLVLPASLCIPAKHNAVSAGRNPECFTYDHLFDLSLLSTVVPVVASGQVASLDQNQTIALRGRAESGRTSKVIRDHFPCRTNTTLLRVELPGYWFMRAVLVAASPFREALLARVDTPCETPCEANKHFALNMLRSGMFFAPRVKLAAAAIIGRLGGASTYVAVRVRRGDRLMDNGIARGWSPVQRDNLTRPEGIGDMLSSFLPSAGTVFILSSEPADFFSPLQTVRGNVVTRDDVSDLMTAHSIHDSFSLFAVELLVSLGAAWYVETFENLLGGFSYGCFPATSIRSNIAAVCRKKGQRGSGCSASHYNVSYGGACIQQQQCSLVPPRCVTPSS